MNKIKILVVDDDMIILQLIRIILQKFGYDVSYISEPAVAAKILKDGGVVILITDCDIPMVNMGIELVRLAKSLAEPPWIIFMSGRVYEGSELASQARAAGASVILEKPFTPKQVYEALRKPDGLPIFGIQGLQLT